MRGWKDASADQVSLLAAGVAFFGFMALFPAMISFTLVWGLIADPASVASQTNSIMGSLPPDARTFFTDQLQNLASASTAKLGWGLVVALVVALWSTSGGVGNLVAAINVAYAQEHRRNIVANKLMALALTAGGVLFTAVLVGLVAGVPAALHLIGVGGALRWLANVLRWVLIVALSMTGLAVLYRVVPDRDAGQKTRWLSVGAVVGTLIWLLASIGFSIYLSLFGNYAKTYGALAGIVVLLMWLWITVYAILVGAEINAQLEGRAARDARRRLRPRTKTQEPAHGVDEPPAGRPASGDQQSIHSLPTSVGR